MCDFTHLHVHTDASPDGLRPVAELVSFAAKLGYSELAMTDHGTFANAIAFYTACAEHKIKPIMGLEAYMLWNGKRHHITLNARSYVGFKNLVAMSNAAHANWTSGYPLMTPDIMSRYAGPSSDVALFTGCPASPIHEGSDSDAMAFVGSMIDIYGQKNVYAEMMFVLDEQTTKRPMLASRHFGIPIVITNDVHYPNQSLQSVHRILTECRKGFSYDSDSLWLKSYDEMVARGRTFFDERDVRAWMLNSKEFASSVTTWDMFSAPKLPRATHLRASFYDAIKVAFERDIAANAESATERSERLQLELKTLEDMEFIDYFCILNDIVGWAISQGILVGPGRGSAAGSYVLYLLGITSVDPVYYKLYFERFLNIHRREYPDVDVDFESERRQEVIDYAVKTWGAFPVATYSHYGHKNSIDDISRVLKLDRQLSDAASENGPESEQFDEWASLHPDALPTYKAVQEQIRHAGKHAGGIVITDQTLPVEQIGGALVAAWTEGDQKELSKVGVVKFDMLGLSALTMIRMMRSMIGATECPPIVDNSQVFDIFCEGNTLGIFQWTGSDGIRELTMRIEPRVFADLCVINSLYRPGALDAGTAEIYPELKITPRLIHPVIDEILADTNGAIVFQEQVMMIFAKVLGGSLAEADMLRRVIFKARPGDPAWEQKVEDLRHKFTTECKLDMKPRQLDELWRELYTHTRYSFNLAHSTAYAKVAYEMAWFKYYHPKVFYAAMLNYDVENIQAYLLEIAARGIVVKTPHVNASAATYIIDDSGAIQMPLSVVKNLSVDGAAKISNEVAANGQFKSIDDFRSRIKKRECNARVARFLWTLGAFDGLSGDTSKLFELDDDAANITKIAAQIEALGFALPTQAMAEYIEFNTEQDVVCGFVQSWHDKVNKRGKPYRVFRLIPHGMFWMPDGFDKLKKGDFVKVRKNSFGKAIDRKRVTFSE